MGTNRSLFTWEMWKNRRKRWRGKGVGGGREREIFTGKFLYPSRNKKNREKKKIFPRENVFPKRW